MASRCVLGLLLLVTLSMRIGVIRAESDESLEDDEEMPGIQETEEPSLEAELQVEAVSAIPDELLRQQADDNASALKRLADVMGNLIHESTNQRCLGTGTNTQQLTDSIKEGFSILVGAVQDLNNTLRHFKDEINVKVFSDSSANAFGDDDGPCPSPFFQAGEDCLYIETEHLRFFDAARQACIDMGAKLAEFSDFAPFLAAVTKMDMHEDAEIYIGGSDREKEGTWEWLSGERMRNVPWGSGEPNALPHEDCIALRPQWKKFNDIRCTQRREYVCKWMN